MLLSNKSSGKDRLGRIVFNSLQKKYPNLEGKGFTCEKISNIVKNSKINITNKGKLKKLIVILEKKILAESKPFQSTILQKPLSLPNNIPNINVKYSSSNMNSNLSSNLNSHLGVGDVLPKQNMSGFASTEQRIGMSQASELFKKSVKASLNNMDKQEEFFSASGNIPTNVSVPKLLKKSKIETTESLDTDRFILRDREKELFNKERIEREYYVVIDSKDREISQYKSPNEYVIHLSPPSYTASDNKTGFISRGFNNIKSVELLECIFRNTSGESDASDSTAPPPYVLLEIEELGGNFEGTNEYLNKAFSILTNYSLLGNYKYYNYVCNKTTDSKAMKVFNPRISLSKLTIRFRLPNGNLYSFGSAYNEDTNTVNKMVFKVTVIQRNLSSQYLDKTDG